MLVRYWRNPTVITVDADGSMADVSNVPKR